MLEEICHIAVEMHLLFNPQNVMIDFEQASMQPFLAIFLPGANKTLLLPFWAIIMEKMSKPWIVECIYITTITIFKIGNIFFFLFLSSH